MFAAFLDAPGPNRIRTIMVLKNAVPMPFEEARALLARVQPRVAVGPKWKMKEIQRLLEIEGARVSVRFYPEGIDTSLWASRISKDCVHCPKCGAKLFFAVPRLTSKQDIAAFGKASKLTSASEIARTGWIHPGVYCPNGCVFMFVEFGDLD